MVTGEVPARRPDDILIAGLVLLAQNVVAGESAAAVIRAAIKRFLPGSAIPKMTRFVLYDLNDAQRS
jgi:hypothetical protein